MAEGIRTLKLPGQRLQRLARALLRKHPLHKASSDNLSTACLQSNNIKVVCVSDTHNTQPSLPSGDILVHAGDLTENGSYEEFQTQLSWLSSQPFEHIVLVAGNHDILLDEASFERFPGRRHAGKKSAQDLEWGRVKYIQDGSITLHVIPSVTSKEVVPREIRVFGSPRTPRYGVSAFQYPRDEDIWSDKIPTGTDIVVTHGPPRLYLDSSGAHKAGCMYLAKEIFRIRPRLVVFGHIHTSYGRVDVILDEARHFHDDILCHRGGYMTLVRLALAVGSAKLQALLPGLNHLQRKQSYTTFVNASVVGGHKNELVNEPIVVCI